MTRFVLCTVHIYFCCATYFSASSKYPHVAFTGCNATWEWNLGNRSSTLERIDVRIKNKTGDVIITTQNDKCASQDTLSVNCVISKKNEDLIILLTLVNITTKDQGNYTSWIKENLHTENMTRELIVIDTPNIIEIRRPIHHKSFAVMCNTSYVSDCLTYHWKINGTYINSTSHVHANSSTLTFTNLTMIDSFNKLACQVGIQRCRSVGCNSYSQESESYTVLPVYGPSNVSLTHNKRDFYLQENETFKVRCSANCYPDCTFRWESHYINVESEELAIKSFNERMSGTYTCIAKHPETGVTSKSYPIFLHPAKVSSNQGDKQVPSRQYGNGDVPLELLGGGLVFVAVSLILVGVSMFVLHRRKEASRRLSSLKVQKACAGPPNREVSRDFIKFDKHDVPLPIPTVQESLCMMMRRSWYPKVNRKSCSLQTILDDNQEFQNTVQKSISLQTLIELSHTIGKRVKSNESLSQMCCSQKGSWPSMEGLTNGIRLEKVCLNVRKNMKTSNDKQNSDPLSLNQNIFPPLRFDQQPQEDLYSVLDETSCPMYDYARVNSHGEYSQEDHINADAGNYLYDYVFLPHL